MAQRGTVSLGADRYVNLPNDGNFQVIWVAATVGMRAACVDEFGFPVGAEQ
jgi:hypothetical protein